MAPWGFIISMDKSTGSLEKIAPGACGLPGYAGKAILCPQCNKPPLAWGHHAEQIHCSLSMDLHPAPPPRGTFLATRRTRSSAEPSDPSQRPQISRVKIPDHQKLEIINVCCFQLLSLGQFVTQQSTALSGLSTASPSGRPCPGGSRSLGRLEGGGPHLQVPALGQATGTGGVPSPFRQSRGRWGRRGTAAPAHTATDPGPLPLHAAPTAISRGPNWEALWGSLLWLMVTHSGITGAPTPAAGHLSLEPHSPPLLLHMQPPRHVSTCPGEAATRGGLASEPGAGTFPHDEIIVQIRSRPHARKSRSCSPAFSLPAVKARALQAVPGVGRGSAGPEPHLHGPSPRKPKAPFLPTADVLAGGQAADGPGEPRRPWDHLTGQEHGWGPPAPPPLTWVTLSSWVPAGLTPGPLPENAAVCSLGEKPWGCRGRCGRS